MEDEYHKLQQSDKEEIQLNLDEKEKSSINRDKWGKDIEFLLSCIALSVGLGNVWRFPFIALNNGGGAFIIPYVIVLLLIGRPVYYMEVIIGQFSSRGCIKAFDFAPIMRGVAYGQVYATAIATTYYACIMGLTIRYLLASFSNVLPWSICKEEWKPNCINAVENISATSKNFTYDKISSSEFYFIKEVLKEKGDISDGIGLPNWDLVGCLALAWLIIICILIKGIKSSGKASYFLAFFPYFTMTILLFRTLTLPGSINGIIYFLKPQWNLLLSPKVWYAATTQAFFALAICFGTLIMYASYNNFNRNIYKDVIIITSMDSIISMIAGFITFGILGHLALETGKDINNVVQGGAGLAFISYPDAISKFEFIPQAFAVLFFLMLLVLGIGSNIGMVSCVITVIKDQFNSLPHWLLAFSISLIGFCFGVVYMTPGGQFVLNLMDYFGASFIALFLAIAELIAVGWIYGVKRFCKDIEFMFGVKTGLYWRICWGVITPALMFLVLIYTLIEFEPLTYKNIPYPFGYYVFGWIIWGIGVLQLPLWAIYEIWRQPQDTIYEKIISACKPSNLWGPLDKEKFNDYQKFLSEVKTTECEDEDEDNEEKKIKESIKIRKKNIWVKFLDNVFN